MIINQVKHELLDHVTPLVLVLAPPDTSIDVR